MSDLFDKISGLVIKYKILKINKINKYIEEIFLCFDFDKNKIYIQLTINIIPLTKIPKVTVVSKNLVINDVIKSKKGCNIKNK